MLTVCHHRPKIAPRDYISVSRIDHKSTKAVSKGMDLSTLFSDSGACMLMPAVDQGPLCKYIRGGWGWWRGGGGGTAGCGGPGGGVRQGR